MDRRSFFKRSGALAAAAAAPAIIPASALGREGRLAPGDRIVMGCIGVGDRGGAVMNGFLRQGDAQIVAVCDVKANVLQQKQEIVNKKYGNQDCKAYKDFRELVARTDIDACLVATCDHWHVLTALAAARAGKDVYMEKPMSPSLEQDIAMREAVKKNNRVFQFGTQQRSDSQFRQACELARNGRLGKLKAVNCWAPGSSQGGPTQVAPVPEWLDYEMWLGPAPKKPYTVDRCSNAWWWFISDYALGFIAGWGIHPIDIAVWGAPDRLEGPWTIEGKGEFPKVEGVCDTAMNWDVTLTTGSGLKLRFTGNPAPKEWKDRYGRDNGHGTAFEGADGWVCVDRNGIEASPKSLLETKWTATDLQLPDGGGDHQRNFLDAVKSRKQPLSNIDDAVRGDTICHVSDVCIRLGRKVTFDPEKEKFVNDDEANKRLTRPLRAPWHL
jgi:predicted dehydrogenase